MKNVIPGTLEGLYENKPWSIILLFLNGRGCGYNVKSTQKSNLLCSLLFLLNNWEGLIVLSESLNRNPGDSETSWMLVCTHLPSIVVSEIFMLIAGMSKPIITTQVIDVCIWCSFWVNCPLNSSLVAPFG